MNLSPSTIYELLFLMTIVGLVALDAAVVVPLRLLLRKWPSVWRKALAIHTVALLAMFALLWPILAGVPWLRYVGITPATLIGFGLFAAAADGLRALQVDRLADPAAGRRVSPWIILVAGGLLAAIVARQTVAADEGKEAVSDIYWASLIMPALQRQSPEREIIPALLRDFPEEGDAILRAYIHRQRDAALRQPGLRTLLPFPREEVRQLIRSKHADIARAPDAQLAAVAAHLAWFADFIAAMPQSCASAAGGGTAVVPEPGVDRIASPQDSRRLGQMVAASLDAARAGIDHPVQRPLSSDRLLALDAEFQRTLPAGLAAIASQRASVAAATSQQRCAVYTARLKWIATLPPEKAAYLFRQGMPAG